MRKFLLLTKTIPTWVTHSPTHNDCLFKFAGNLSAQEQQLAWLGDFEFDWADSIWAVTFICFINNYVYEIDFAILHTAIKLYLNLE